MNESTNWTYLTLDAVHALHLTWLTYPPLLLPKHIDQVRVELGLSVYELGHAGR
jgi:hypothetical protein